MFSISIDVSWLVIIVVMSALAGFIFRSGQIRKNQMRIRSLENEMLHNHAEILKLQHELVIIKEEKLQPYKMKLVPIDDSSNADSKKEFVPRQIKNNG